MTQKVKDVYCIVIILLVCSCNTQSHQTNQDCIQLIDTIIDGSHIRMTVSISDSINTYLHVFHDDLIDSLPIKDYSDIDVKDALLFKDQQKQIVNTWIAKTKSLFIFVLPYHSSIGLYAYRIDSNKISFVTTPERRPIYSDYAFYAQFNSDIITTCYQPSARNTSGAAIWELGDNKNEIKKKTTIASDTYLVTDRVEFMTILDSTYNTK